MGLSSTCLGPLGNKGCNSFPHITHNTRVVFTRIWSPTQLHMRKETIHAYWLWITVLKTFEIYFTVFSCTVSHGMISELYSTVNNDPKNRPLATLATALLRACTATSGWYLKVTVDGNQKSGKLTSWGKGSLFIPIIYRAKKKKTSQGGAGLLPSTVFHHLNFLKSLGMTAPGLPINLSFYCLVYY